MDASQIKSVRELSHLINSRNHAVVAREIEALTSSFHPYTATLDVAASIITDRDHFPTRASFERRRPRRNPRSSNAKLDSVLSRTRATEPTTTFAKTTRIRVCASRRLVRRFSSATLGKRRKIVETIIRHGPALVKINFFLKRTHRGRCRCRCRCRGR